MKAVTWQGVHDMQVTEVPDPRIEEPTDIVIRVTSTGLCGSDLHLYETLGAFMEPGDVVGHEPMGIVEEVGADVTKVAVGDRVVIPFNVSCGSCWMCDKQLYSQCETTQNREHGTGSSLFGYSKLYGQVPGGQAEYLRVPFGNFLPVKVPHEHSDDRFLFLSDVLPTAWQGLKYADVPDGGTLLVLGAGPIGDMAARMGVRAGHRVISVDRVPERLARVQAFGAETINFDDVKSDGGVAAVVREMTDGRGADSVIDAVGMEAHGSPVAQGLQKFVGLLPDAIAEPMMKKAGIDRLAALHTALEAVRRGGTVSLSGVYGGAVDPMPMFQMFDKQVQLRMGQANVRAHTDELLAMLVEDDPFGVDAFATHHLPLDEAPQAYQHFQKKEEGMVKVVFKP
ncbi:zinc-dependent alcohol dehydrogenase [Nocardioides jishulii]|uniref:Glutathione-dependent formaldehyde dehydrogenase n=1 Tax=Nocardioides jishulii TaxID=2575440 RepID=A0A4V5TKM5_9ACTN|nr:zinc-dependent alcohol dehydrogenase [Nocardioides jishulii]QCX28810.1 glutathione-dependent formaldehyde dehydrogenase [Nocardioides jishulii]TKI64293.1 glutathione-dependent formaldehyde dehydrogenase [Nocardioides jishulii]